ncbi:MAG: DNA polymerase III subunit gamma/tau [Microbacterium sp.]|uniref:DNA polymerase III subunit gamma/tau n=1 Tax=Microbacterium sp. TaxID=51671 RepID=UPI001AD4D214|nr:DNA polymerase III subunit gamma/tau [Microbacterium sp.]MBN9176163.1 DNA polymerase III subunit gamma/tau [Microbacterium sp.]
MSTGRDDDALRWDGDDDPTLVASKAPEPTSPAATPSTPSEPLALPDGFTAVGKDSEKVGHIEADGAVVMPGERAQLSSAVLLTLGVLAGAYVLFTVGWIIGGLRLQGASQVLIGPVGYQAALWTAVAAPLLWFVGVYVLTRASKTWVRVTWLFAGLALLAPWPFLMVAAVGMVAS